MSHQAGRRSVRVTAAKGTKVMAFATTIQYHPAWACSLRTRFFLLTLGHGRILRLLTVSFCSCTCHTVTAVSKLAGRVAIFRAGMNSTQCRLGHTVGQRFIGEIFLFACAVLRRPIFAGLVPSSWRFSSRRISLYTGLLGMVTCRQSSHST